MSYGEIIAVASLLLNIVVAVVGYTLGIGRINASVAETFETEIDGQREISRKSIDDLKNLISETELAIERKVGEMGAALRTKITEVELFTRDTFVRRDTFQEMTKMLTTNMQTQFDRLQASVDRLYDKLDPRSG